MSLMLGIVSMRAQEIPDATALADTLRAACDTSKIKAGLQSVAAQADTIITAIDAAVAAEAAKIQKDDMNTPAQQDKVSKTETAAKQDKGKADKTEAATEQDKDETAKTEAATEQDKDETAKTEAVAKQDKDETAKAEATAEQDKDKTAQDVAEKDDEQKKESERPKVSHAGKFFIMLQGGAAFNYYENSFMYQENNQVGKMFTPQGALSFGMDFTETFGTRLQLACGTDAGACNNRETASRGFYPYTFKHVNAFVDAMLNLGAMEGKGTRFRPKFYLGAGLAHTFGFSDPNHPWQVVNSPNTVFGFRGGIVTEYCFRSGFGIFADICGEGYTDSYNGLQPSKEDQAREPGYAGFPMDLRGLASFGIVFHF